MIISSINQLFEKNELSEWDLFVLRHQIVGNVVVHFISFLLFWLSPLFALIYFNPYLLFGFFISGFVGGFGHWFFKDGTIDKKEATSSLQVVLFSSFMALQFLRGRYFDNVRLTRSKYQQFKLGQIHSRVNTELFDKLSPVVREGR